MMRVSIVIPTLGRLHLLDALDRLVMTITGREDIIVVADDPSQWEYLRVSPHGLNGVDKLIINRERVGIGHALNQGIEAAGDSDVVLMNDDVFVEKGWLEPLIEATRQNPRLIPCATQLDPQTKRSGACVTISGCSFHTRESLREIGPFDEHPNFWHGGMDYDYYLRAVKLGYIPARVCESHVVHLTGGTLSEEMGVQENVLGVWNRIFDLHGVHPCTYEAMFRYPEYSVAMPWMTGAVQ